MSVEITRTLVYTYADEETAIDDQMHWGVPANGTFRPNSKLTVVSSIVVTSSSTPPEEAGS